MERNYEDRFLEIVEKTEKGWERYDRMVENLRAYNSWIINPKKALLFLEDDLERAEKVLEVLNGEEAVEFIHRPTKRRPRVLFSERSFSRVAEALDKEWISYIEVPTVVVSALPVVDQRIIRNRLYQWEELLFLIERVEKKDFSELENEKEKSVWETIRRAEEVARVANVQEERTIFLDSNHRLDTIYFDKEFKEKGVIVVFTQGWAKGYAQKDLLMVSKRAITLLDLLNIPYYKVN